MTLNKKQKDKAFETHVREQMQQRTMEPSAQAWDRLDAMLTVAETPRNTFRWWYAVAAIFILGGVVGLWQWQQPMAHVEGQGIVVEDIQLENNQKPIDSTTKEIFPAMVEELVVEVKSEVKTNTQTQIKKTPQREMHIVHSPDALVIHETPVELKSPKPDTEFEPKLESAIAKKSSLSVDPLKLLNSVEKEVEIQHRNKVIESINKNYQTVKQALATRNQE